MSVYKYTGKRQYTSIRTNISIQVYAIRMKLWIEFWGSRARRRQRVAQHHIDWCVLSSWAPPLRPGQLFQISNFPYSFALIILKNAQISKFPTWANNVSPLTAVVQNSC